MPTEYEIVTTAKKGCRFCGSKTVAWFQTTDGEKWYLAEAFEIDGETRASKTDFHSKYCATAKRKRDEPRLDHDEEQRKHTQREQDDEDAREELRNKAEDRANEKSAERFLSLMSMTDAEKDHEISKLEREMDAFRRNPPTMDYMTEFTRENAAQGQRQVEWKFLKALTGDPQEENYSG